MSDSDIDEYDSEDGYWTTEARDGAEKLASAYGVRIEDVAAVVEAIPDGLPEEAPVSRLAGLAEKSELDVTVVRHGPLPESPTDLINLSDEGTYDIPLVNAHTGEEHVETVDADSPTDAMQKASDPPNTYVALSFAAKHATGDRILRPE